MSSLLFGVVEFCRRRAVLVLVLTTILTAASVVYTARNLGVDTDTADLIAPDPVFQKQIEHFDRVFPLGKNVTTIVLDGRSADAVADGTAALAAALAKRPDMFRSVERPDGGPFFDTYGLMLLSTPELSKVADQVIEAQPLLGPLAADPSLRGLFGVLGKALGGLEGGEATGGKLQRPMAAFTDAIHSIANGRPTPVDWGALMTGQPPRPDQLRHFIDVQPVLDFGALEPGAPASRLIRETAAALHLADRGVRVRLTGDVPLEDEEFASVTQGAGTATAITAVAVIVILLVGLRAPRLLAAIAITVIVGLCLSAGFAALAVGTLNMISIAFAVLFIGIGVDFGIQFSMRYRAELFAVTTGAAPTDARAANGEALRRTGRAITGPLTVAAVATAVGFYAFLPTDYRGVSELGLIAGTSMLIALAGSLTVLPALIALMPGRGRPEAGGFTWAAPLDQYLARHAWAVVVVAAVAAFAAIAVVPLLRFDSDPLDLKDPRAESVQTAVELTSDKLTSPYSIDVLAPDADSAGPLAGRLEKVAGVKQVIWLGSFVPEDQQAKLDILGQLQLVLTPILDGTSAPAPPTDDEERGAVVRYTMRLEQFLAGAHRADLGAAGPNLLAALKGFQATPDANIHLLQTVLLQGLPGRIDTLKKAVEAGPLTLAAMPPEIRQDWIGTDGSARLEVFPAGDMKDPDTLRRFVASVRAAAPNATGAPVGILESGKTVSSAFVTASITALIAITITLCIILRRVRDVLLVLVPLVFAGLYAMAACVVTGLAFNYANVIAIPLLMGIGVAFDIYFVMAWRTGSGPVALLQSATARAVVFSAFTTTTAFGSLALSHHAGTASMGLLLMLTLFFVVLSTLIVQPALMTVVGRGRDR